MNQMEAKPLKLRCSKTCLICQLGKTGGNAFCLQDLILKWECLGDADFAMVSSIANLKISLCNKNKFELEITMPTSGEKEEMTYMENDKKFETPQGTTGQFR